MISFDCRLAYPGFDFDVAFEAGSGVTALFGRSGSGKTTAIRLLSGIERPARGRIVINSAAVLDTSTSVFMPSHRRRIGLVYQDAQLLPHLTVGQNLGYGQWFAAKSERRIGFSSVVDVLGIGQLLDRRPSALSGGERQRVAIGRALLSSPRLLLMDEPLASLDAARKLEILPFIERLRDEFRIPIIYVSHAVDEVARLAEQVVCLEDGKVIAAGSPGDVLGTNSATTGSDRFEIMSFLTGIVDHHEIDYRVSVIRHPAGDIVIPARPETVGATVRIAIPASAVSLAVSRPSGISIRTALEGRIQRIDRERGPFTLVSITLPGGEVIKASVTRMALDLMALGEGDAVTVLVKTASVDERSVTGAFGPCVPPDLS